MRAPPTAPHTGAAAGAPTANAPMHTPAARRPMGVATAQATSFCHQFAAVLTPPAGITNTRLLSTANNSPSKSGPPSAGG